MVAQVQVIANNLINDPNAAIQVTIREFLSWYDAKRRGQNVVARIRTDLAENNLRTKPDFESVWIGGSVTIEKAPPVEMNNEVTEAEPGTLMVGEEGEVPAADDLNHAGSNQWVPNDPTHQLSKLQAANKKVLSVFPGDLISVAVTKMLLHDYSQLPVMTNERDVRGVISWKSIGAHLVLGGIGGNVSNAMNTHQELLDAASIFEAIGVVARHDYVLVRDTTRKITGIVTASDLTEQFRNLSEPFLLLSEIENHLRNMIAQRFNLADLEAARNEADQRPITTVADLTFGEYIRLLTSPENWARFGLNLDRTYFCKRLDVVREMRNEVMHFDPDGFEPEQLKELEEFVSALRTIQGPRLGRFISACI